MEELVVLANGKCRRKCSPEHALFDAGNALRMNKFYVDAGVALPEEEEEVQPQREPVFVCRLFNCNGVGFHSLYAYEEHYDLMHRNVCQECFRSFLSFRLLDIHLSESHDAFFRVLAKQKPMYVCLVDGCDQIFKHDDKRTRHLVQDHGYPANFSFQKPRRRRKTPTNRPTARDQRQQIHSSSTADGTVRDVDAVKIAKAQARKAKRKEKKKQQRAEEKAADQDMTAEEIAAEERVDAEMEEVALAAEADGDVEGQLAARMAQLQFVPKSIAFGRRQQRRR